MGAELPESTATWSVGSAPGGPPELGTAMGRYRLETVVGAGGMGMVFAAHDPELARRVAVKVMRPHVDGEEATQRLRREAQTMAQLVHPNVIRIYDVGVAHGSLFIAMEYVEGGTLDAWLHRTSRDVDEIVRVFGLAGHGLAAAHAAGVVHRDFKPSNVLVGDDGRVLVTDFGLARSAGSPDDTTADDSAPVFPEITRTGGIVGTPAFMAPEQSAGGTVDARADQFSFCVALWRSLYGASPYESSRRGEIVSPAGDVARRVSPRVRAVLERGLRPLPSDRFASMNDLLHALEPRRRRWWFAIAGALVIVTLAVWWLTRVPAPSPSHRYQMHRITSAGDAGNAAMSPDGRYVALSVPDKLERVSVDDGSVRVLATGADPVGVVSWSQDGRNIGYPRLPTGASFEDVVIAADDGGFRKSFGTWNVVLGAPDQVLLYRAALHRFFIGTMAGNEWKPCDLPGDFAWVVKVVVSGDDVFIGVLGEHETYPYVVRTDARCTSAITIAEGLELTSLAPAPHGVVALARAGAEYQLVALDRDGHAEQLGAVARGSSAHVVGARPDGSVLLIDGEDTWRLLRVSPHESVQEIMTGSHSAQFDISPDGTRVALIDRAAARNGEPGPLRVVPLVDAHTRLPPIETEATATAWSPDGSRLAALVRTRDGSVVVTENADGSSRTVHKTAGTSFDPSIVWVDADTVAYLTAGRRAYRAIALHDQSQRDLFDRKVRVVLAAQREPHGNRFLVQWDRTPTDPPETRVVDADGGAHELPAVGTDRAWWSADGRSLFVAASQHAIDIVDLGTGVRRPYATIPDDQHSAITNIVQLPGGDLLVATARSVYDLVLVKPIAD